MSIHKIYYLRERLSSCVRGSESAGTLLIIALLAGGHVLIEGAPGIGKTSIAQTLADSINGDFKRIQFTPDLLPSDIMGYSMYKQNTGEFEFIPGAVFTNLLLADEINRTSPRVQSALLEAMNDGQVTIDGVSYPLAKPFMVAATQNANSTSGTFPLPEPQLDRFLLSIVMDLPNAQTQLDILNAHCSGNLDTNEKTTFIDNNEVLALQRLAKSLPVSSNLNDYIVRLCEEVRRAAGGAHTVSIRGSLALMRAAQAYALLDGVSAVHPDHVQEMFVPVMRHRVVPEDGTPSMAILAKVLKETPVV